MMKHCLRCSVLSVLIVVGAATAFGQSYALTPVNASDFMWRSYTSTAVAAGSATVIAETPTVATRGGYYISVFASNTPVSFDAGAIQETVTPSSVSCTGTTCSFTGTFSNAHTGRYIMQSGSYGLYEAITYLKSLGGGTVRITRDWSGTAANITTALNSVANSNIVIEDVRGPYVLYGTNLVGACTGTATASSTLFLNPIGETTATTCSVTSEASWFTAPHAGEISNLQVTAGTGGVNASSGVFTVRKNKATTTITCTTGTTTSCSDTAHSVPVNAGDLISVQFTTQASETLANAVVTVTYQ